MDFPSNPIAGLLNGEFHDGDPLNNVPGSVILSEWANNITNELIAVIEDAGLTPDENDAAQLLAAIKIVALTAAGGQLTGSLGFVQGSDVVSQSELALSGAATKGNLHSVTGTTNIDTIDAGYTHSPLLLRFEGVLTINHSGALRLPGSANIVTTAGDVGMFWRIDGAWQCIFYMRADGSVLVEPAAAAKRTVNASIVNGTDADHDIDFQPGIYYANDAGTIEIDTPIIKQLDAAFAEGSAAGGHAGDAVAADGTFHCFAIEKPDGTVDAYFDSSISAANRPGGFTRHAYMGSVLLDGSSNIIPFLQFGNRFYYRTAITDASGSTATTLAVSVPVGLPLELIYGSTHVSTVTHSFNILGETGPHSPAIGNVQGIYGQIMTNTLGQIGVTVSGGNYTLFTYGYVNHHLALGALHP